MAATLGVGPSGHDDAEYQEALNHFHLGEWQEAILALEKLHGRYPDDPRIQRMLDDARFKATIDATATVREKRWIVPWRAILVRVAMISVVIALIVLGFSLLRMIVLPKLAEVQLERQQAVMLAEAKALQTTGDLNAAEEKFLAILAQFPDLVPAQEGLAAVRKERELFALYDRAVTAQKDKQYDAALTLFNDLQMQSPGYRDVSTRILAIKHQEELTTLFERASTLKALGLEQEAIDTLKQIQIMDVNYRQAEINELLASLNLKQGQRIIDEVPAEPAKVPQALEYFNAALQQKPNDPTALMEARLAVHFMAGSDAYEQGQWPKAVDRFRTIYNARASYLDGSVAAMLYTSLINLGDQLAENDLLAAYENYSQACNLPVPDNVTACAKASAVIPLLTPTPTPTLTPTVGPTAVPATATMTPTPRPFDMFRGRIIFKSDNPELPGYYVMDPDGTSREYLGTFEYYAKLFEALRETERFSPDKQYSVSTAKVDGVAQIILHLPFDKRWGQLPPQPLTRITGMCYDPVWAPDGSWVAFVSQENGSDDVWLIRPDSSDQKALVNNDWEWDKHPSWSPDSQRIVFFSNRPGTMQIYIMDASGQNPRNISNVPWPEYDPIWVK
jgi:tetratricopeptide (TPR) repeat protein